MKDKPIYPDPMRSAEQSRFNQNPELLNEGMTLLEHYAGEAMQGLLRYTPYVGDYENTAKDAVKHALALIEELKKHQS